MLDQRPQPPAHDSPDALPRVRMISDEREVPAQLDTAGDPPPSSQARRIAAAVSSSRTSMCGAWDHAQQRQVVATAWCCAEPPMVPERVGAPRE
ncbi:MAG TPA: hypothetical protein VE268_12895, partial [Herpetosiphonaceae bacterium]|nr:hypothetical protein [Herpetosiphonaceae bacterium]